MLTSLAVPPRSVPAACVLAALAAVPAFAQAPESLDAPAYRVVRPTLATAGQPSPEAIGKLADVGFKTVVNLRMESEEGVPEEGQAVRELGLGYVHVPISPATFSLEDVEAVASVLDDAGQAPVLLHCASANRVGGVWAVMQVQRGVARETAIQEGREIGLRDGVMLEAVERLLDGLESPQPPGE
jgi:uncharacterized protein (TIGR01244 family)